MRALMAFPGWDTLALDVGIAVMLAVALPLARAAAGARLGESAVRRRLVVLITALGSMAWIAATSALALAGVLSQWERTPPPMLLLMALSVVIVVVMAYSPFGGTLARGLPLWGIVGFQAFRIPVEFMLHSAYAAGVIGVQMTWSGRNFDVVSGASALCLGAWLASRGDGTRAPRALIWAWNVLGFALLANIVVVAILSMPTRLLAFDGPPNAWVADFPFVWLPTVMVTAALFGHLLLTRRLIADARSDGRSIA